MKILTPGHKYELDNFEKPQERQLIQFIEKVPVKEGGAELRTVKDGTTNEEVLAMLVDRLRFIHDKVPSRQSALAITKIEEALMWLNNRTTERKSRGVEGTNAK